MKRQSDEGRLADDLPEIDVDQMSADDLDALPFGAIKINSDGVILFYNQAEGRLSGRTPARVIGQNFFHQVAPCTNMPGFYGRFRDVVIAERGRASFDFVFDFAMRPVRVRIDMRPATALHEYWILVRPIEFLDAKRSIDARQSIAAARLRVSGAASDTAICNREDINHTNAIQPHGALICLDSNLAMVTHASQNLHELCGVHSHEVVGHPAGTIFSEAFLRGLAQHLPTRSLREAGIAQIGPDGRWYRFLAHSSGGSVLIELEPEADLRPSSGYRSMPEHGFLEAFADLLINSSSDIYLAQTAVRELRKFTGFDRVLIYEFDLSGDGKVIAEDKETDWGQSLVGLRFPASDIPAQARRLYLRNRVRHTPDNDYRPVALDAAPGLSGKEPLDLGMSLLRSISPIHQEYQRNLGVSGAFSASIVVEGSLWGLVIGHHRTPRRLYWSSLLAVERAAELLGPRMRRAETDDTQNQKKEHERRHRQFLEQLVRSDDFPRSLVLGPTTLLHLFVGTVGAVARVGEWTELVGLTPPLEVIEKLIFWLAENVEEEVWSTECISGYVPEMIDCKSIASGVMCLFLTPDRRDFLIWLRPEIEDRVVWAGDPAEKHTEDGMVLPRKRFERWIELRSAHSLPWAAWKLELAARLKHAVTSLLSAQFAKLSAMNRQLSEANSVKSQFLAQMSHELRTPLNAVIGFSEMMKLGFGGPVTPKQEGYLADILGAGNHLLSLISDILVFSKLEAGKYALNFVEVNVVTLVNGVIELMAAEASLKRIALSPLPTAEIIATVDERSMMQILMNLVSNAVKFTPEGGQVRLEVSESDAFVVMRVIDTGIGIKESNLPQVGQPFYQAGDIYMASEGTGLGLSIVKALVAANDGAFDIQSSLGVGTTVTVTLPRKPS